MQGLIMDMPLMAAPRWWLPDAVEFIDQMPLTGNCKLWKLKLRERFRGYRLGS